MYKGAVENNEIMSYKDVKPLVGSPPDDLSILIIRSIYCLSVSIWGIYLQIARPRGRILKNGEMEGLVMLSERDFAEFKRGSLQMIVLYLLREGDQHG